ncbi:MAG TPA: multidrug ABC transporter substrate-binding protein [Bacteroidetes bacterium]|nr:multidrug ABC transporter substrate-binding protein [Bacteroidota bacterium]
MGIFDIFEIALISLTRNKVRSFLTMLGIIIGVGAVIAMMAVGTGAQENIKSQIASLGTNVILVFPGSFNQGGVRSGTGTSASLTPEDLIAIQTQCPSVALASPSVRDGAQIVYQEQNWRASIIGATPEYFTIRSWPVSSGQYFTDADIRGATKVCVIGQTIADNLFKENDPVGQVIRIRKMPFRIVGVLSVKGQSAQGSDQDDIIIAPYTTVQKKMTGQTFLSNIMISAISEDAMVDAQSQIAELLRVRHKLQPWDENDFTVRSQTEIATAAQSTSEVLTILLASIASISLIVGGIGIMNIMPVSVTERTKEIGIRMAIGATAKNIMMQFLIEAVVLSLLGGLIGVLLGVLSSTLISKFAGWTTMVSSTSIFLAFTFSAAIGIFFGLYPARKAAQLNPIDALRYE